MPRVPLRRAATALPAALLVLGLLPGAAAAGDARLQVVHFVAGSTPQERRATVEKAGGTASRFAGAGDYALTRLTPSAAARLAAVPDVVGVAPPVRLTALGASPRLATSTPSGDPAAAPRWSLPAVQAAQAWTTTSGEGTVVAVVDSGVAAYPGQPTPVVPSIPQDRLLPGRDFVDGDDVPQDLSGHGTFVAGVIAAGASDDRGPAGLAYGAKIMPIRVLDGRGDGTDFQVAQGIRYAVNRGADVINLSLGGPTSSSVLQDAVRYAVDAGVVVVAASGNQGTRFVGYPAGFDGVLAVGSTGRTGAATSYSSYGPRLALVAPGGDVTQDLDHDGYPDGIVQESLDPADRSKTCFCMEDGTSFAAPMVAAAAALVESVGLRDAAQVRSVLTASAKDLGPRGRDELSGAGLLQAADAVALAVARVSAPAAPANKALLTPTNGSARALDAVCPSGQVPLGWYADVDPASVHARAIDCLAWYGISRGRADRAYDPGATVSRGQLASFLVRELEAAGLHLPEDVPDAFYDDDGDVHENDINRLADAGVVLGRTPNIYGPSVPVARDAMATFLMRAYTAATGTVLTSRSDFFDDDTGDVHESAIDAAARYGIATGTGVRRFDPQVPVRRDQMASFLTRLLQAYGEVGVVSRP